MKTKYIIGLETNEKPIRLHLLLENDINTLTTFSDEKLLDINKSIHDIRKSLKSTSAILLLYKGQTDRVQYESWSLFLKSISKHFASFREPYVYLQTFNQLRGDLKNMDKSNFVELRNHFELKYRLLVEENEKTKEAIKLLKESIGKLSTEIENTQIVSGFKFLKKKHWKTFQKTRQLFKTLTLTSSVEDYHKFRKWSRYFYFQQTVFKGLSLKKVSSKEVHKLHKLTEYLGEEHDLQLFYQYLKTQFTGISEIVQPFLLRKIKRLRKKVLVLYPQIDS